MESSLLIDACLYTALLSLLPLGIALVTGICVAILQTATQIQEQTLPIVVKIVAVSLSLFVVIPYLGPELVEYTIRTWNEAR